MNLCFCTIDLLIFCFCTAWCDCSACKIPVSTCFHYSQHSQCWICALILSGKCKKVFEFLCFLFLLWYIHVLLLVISFFSTLWIFRSSCLPISNEWFWDVFQVSIQWALLLSKFKWTIFKLSKIGFCFSFLELHHSSLWT